jgi:hypothetical protein
LVLPILDFDQRLCSIQFISESGQKNYFLAVGKKAVLSRFPSPRIFKMRTHRWQFARVLRPD